MTIYNNLHGMVASLVPANDQATKIYTCENDRATTVNVQAINLGVGDEQVKTGTFAADQNWTKGNGWQISGGKATRLAATINLTTNPTMAGSTANGWGVTGSSSYDSTYANFISTNTSESALINTNPTDFTKWEVLYDGVPYSTTGTIPYSVSDNSGVKSYKETVLRQEVSGFIPGNIYALIIPSYTSNSYPNNDDMQVLVSLGGGVESSVTSKGSNNSSHQDVGTAFVLVKAGSADSVLKVRIRCVTSTNNNTVTNTCTIGGIYLRDPIACPVVKISQAVSLTPGRLYKVQYSFVSAGVSAAYSNVFSRSTSGCVVAVLNGTAGIPYNNSNSGGLGTTVVSSAQINNPTGAPSNWVTNSDYIVAGASGGLELRIMAPAVSSVGVACVYIYEVDPLTQDLTAALVPGCTYKLDITLGNPNGVGSITPAIGTDFYTPVKVGKTSLTITPSMAGPLRLIPDTAFASDIKAVSLMPLSTTAKVSIMRLPTDASVPDNTSYLGTRNVSLVVDADTSWKGVPLAPGQKIMVKTDKPTVCFQVSGSGDMV